MVEWNYVLYLIAITQKLDVVFLQDKIRNDDENKGNLMNILFQMQLKIMLSKLKEF